MALAKIRKNSGNIGEQAERYAGAAVQFVYRQ